MGTMERREELTGREEMGSKPHLHQQGSQSSLPVQVIPEEMESDDENAKEVIPDSIPYWPNLEQK